MRAVAFGVALFGSPLSAPDALGAGRPAAMAAMGSTAGAAEASPPASEPSGRTDTVFTRFGSGQPLFVVATLVARGGPTGTDAAPSAAAETEPSFAPPSVITRICLTCW